MNLNILLNKNNFHLWNLDTKKKNVNDLLKLEIG